jgi:hypothetical protein
MNRSTRSILKRLITVDPSGRVLTGNTERLTDDGRGRLQVTERRIIGWCSNCRRPISDPNERYGRCDYCGRRACCERCRAVCRVCSRLLCRACRRGFAGSTLLTVCPACYVRLRQRQVFVDQMLVRKAAIQSQILRQRERTRIHALRLQAARTRMMGQLQAARIRNSGRLAVLREMNKIKMALAKSGYRRAWYLR